MDIIHLGGRWYMIDGRGYECDTDVDAQAMATYLSAQK